MEKNFHNLYGIFKYIIRIDQTSLHIPIVLTFLLLQMLYRLLLVFTLFAYVVYSIRSTIRSYEDSELVQSESAKRRRRAESDALRILCLEGLSELGEEEEEVAGEEMQEVLSAFVDSIGERESGGGDGDGVNLVAIRGLEKVIAKAHY